MLTHKISFTNFFGNKKDCPKINNSQTLTNVTKFISLLDPGRNKIKMITVNSIALQFGFVSSGQKFITLLMSITLKCDNNSCILGRNFPILAAATHYNCYKVSGTDVESFSSYALKCFWTMDWLDAQFALFEVDFVKNSSWLFPIFSNTCKQLTLISSIYLSIDL